VTTDIINEQLLAGRYELGEQIGAGGVGRIFEAHDRLLDRAVAVKVIPTGSKGERALTEARAAARLSHRNIAAVLDAGDESGWSYIIMELLAGPSLEEELAERGRLSPEDVRELAGQALAALAEAHADGTVHCDIKPSNILRAADGTWKLVDFGIACAGSDEPENGLWGTPAYVPPERLAGASAAPAGDLYSLSVVLYEALTGVQPFARGGVDATIAAVRAGRHVATASARPDADPHLSAAIDRGMAPDPWDRFIDAHDMAAAIQQPERSTPMLATTPMATAPIATVPLAVPAPTKRLATAQADPAATPRLKTGPAVVDARRHRWTFIALGAGTAVVALLVVLVLATASETVRARGRFPRTAAVGGAFTGVAPAIHISPTPVTSTSVRSGAPSTGAHGDSAGSETGNGHGNGNGHAYGHSKGNH
jgi:serine/threonine-protein kinase